VVDSLARTAHDVVPGNSQSEIPVLPAQDPPELRRHVELLKHRGSLHLGEALLELGLITPAQLTSALDAKAEVPDVPLGTILQRTGEISAEAIQAGLAFHLGVPAIDLHEWPVDSAIVAELQPALLRAHQLFPVWREGNSLFVAMSDVLNQTALDAMRLHTPYSVHPVYAPASDIRQMLDRYCLTGATLPVSDEDLERNMAKYAGDVHALLSDPVTANDNVIVRLADQIIAEAHRERASDIHIEPMPEREKTIVRIRVDGRMLVQRRIPWVYQDALVSRYKVMANLNVAEHRVPQDGKIRFHKPGTDPFELRVAVLPTAGGVEDIVLRILDTNKALPLTALGLADPIESKLRELIEKPYGILLVCGPTGSGKTTTLHAVLRHLNDGSRKIWTVENPVEITQPGLRQVQVNPVAGLTFATVLRAFLRADPDVVMVGEVRDVETAKTALEASLTGHMVLSTLHTNNAPESIVRLLEMGMNPFNFSDALLGILAQRLVRCLCPDCREPVGNPDALLARLAAEYGAGNSGHGSDESARLVAQWRQEYDEITLYGPGGCSNCGNTGYKGRIGLFELLPATKEVKKLVTERASAEDMFTLAAEQGMRTLKQDGIDKVLRGLTDLSQVLAVSQR